MADGCDYVTPGCLNATQWDDLWGFSQAAQADFIFGVAFGLAEVRAAEPVQGSLRSVV